MRTREDIEAYLSRSNPPHKEVAEDTWLVSDPSDARDNIVVRVTDGLVIFRLKVLELEVDPAARRAALFENLLRFNAEDMVHGAYGLVNGDLVMVATLRLENLDYNEFVAVLEDFILAMSNHHERLAAHAGKA